MLYWLSQFTDSLSVLNVFRYITVRTGAAVVLSFVLCLILAPLFIKRMKSLKLGEVAKRDDAPDLDQYLENKEGTPTMGGVFIVTSIVLTTLICADLNNPYVLLTLITGVWLAVLGGIDDYMKLKKIGEKRGLSARTKLIWQILLATFIGSYIHFNPNMSTLIDIPFFKNAAFNAGALYILSTSLVIVGTSNAVNLTDGLDGLAIGCVLIVAMTMAGLCYIAGHYGFSNYLFLPYVSGCGELSVFCGAIIGASLGFLWFNSHPAEIFMGDVGSLSLGGTLGVMAVFAKKELWLAVLGGVFVIEAGSVILQVWSYKLTGKRIFKCAPFHHHLQHSKWHESKIIIRLWIIGIVFALMTLAMLKIR